MSAVTLADQIAALHSATPAELAANYVALFGKQPRRRHPDYLRKRIAFRLQESALGGLSRKARAVVDELASEIALPATPSSAPTRPRGGELRPGSVLEREWHGQLVRVEVMSDGFIWNGNS